MTLTQACEHCGESRAYEYAMGDRSGLCWRDACAESRQRQAERYRERCEAYERHERAARLRARSRNESATEVIRPCESN